MTAESRQQPGEASARQHPLTGIAPAIEITALRGHRLSGSARHRAAASATRLPTVSAVHVQAAAAERSSWRLFILGVFSWMLGDAGRSVTAAVAENSYEAGY